MTAATAGCSSTQRVATLAIDTLCFRAILSAAASIGPFLLGTTFSAVDPYALMLSRWTRGFARPARSLPHLGAYLTRMLDRPAVQRVIAQEGLVAPLV